MAKTTTNKATTRSEIIRAVKSKTQRQKRPCVAPYIYRCGFRFRLHNHEHPGKPDIVLPKDKTVIRVMGCFWHGHKCRRGNRVPKINQAYWVTKIARNKKTDKEQKRQLEKQGWRTVDVCECSLRDKECLSVLAAKPRN